MKNILVPTRALLTKIRVLAEKTFKIDNKSCTEFLGLRIDEHQSRYITILIT